jgi:RNA polymerase sigma-70 factor (ECF subfamily)
MARMDARAQDGDEDAYRMVLRAMVPAIRRMAARRIFDPALVEDAVQDTLMTIHRLRHTYDPARPLMPWLSAIATARAIDVLRRAGRSHRREVADADAMAAAHAPADPVQAWSDERDVARLLAQLPERQRMMVDMVKLKDMSLDEAAQASRLSVSAVKSLFHRALARLQEDGNG